MAKEHSWTPDTADPQVDLSWHEGTPFSKWLQDPLQTVDIVRVLRFAEDPAWSTPILERGQEIAGDQVKFRELDELYVALAGAGEMTRLYARSSQLRGTDVEVIKRYLDNTLPSGFWRPLTLKPKSVRQSPSDLSRDGALNTVRVKFRPSEQLHYQRQDLTGAINMAVGSKLRWEKNHPNRMVIGEYAGFLTVSITEQLTPLLPDEITFGPAQVLIETIDDPRPPKLTL